MLKSLFSKQTLELCPDIDKGIEYIFSIYKGKYEKTIYQNRSFESMSDIGADCAWPVCTIKTDEKYYCLEWKEWSEEEQGSNPKLKGIYNLVVEECDKNTKNCKASDLIAGVYYPSHKTDNDNVDGLMNALFRREKDTLENILSDKLLNNSEGMKNLDKLYNRYEPSYSKILTAWNINNTVCIKIMHIDIFICMHYDDKQTNKISSIRVFNFKDANEKDISQYDFGKDAPGVYLPDFLGADGKLHDEPVREE